MLISGSIQFFSSKALCSFIFSTAALPSAVIHSFPFFPLSIRVFELRETFNLPSPSPAFSFVFSFRFYFKYRDVLVHRPHRGWRSGHCVPTEGLPSSTTRSSVHKHTATAESYSLRKENHSSAKTISSTSTTSGGLWFRKTTLVIFMFLTVFLRISSVPVD